MTVGPHFIGQQAPVIIQQVSAASRAASNSCSGFIARLIICAASRSCWVAAGRRVRGDMTGAAAASSESDRRRPEPLDEAG